MRKYKQVKEKKVVYSLDEWAVIEHRAAKLAMKTGTYIKRISVDGEIKYYSIGDIAAVMNALRIIGGNINQIAKKANETHSADAGTVEELRKEVDALSIVLSKSHSYLERIVNISLQQQKSINLSINGFMLFFS